MRRVAFRQELTGSPLLDRAQRLAQESNIRLTSAVEAVPFQGGVFVRGAAIGTTDTVVTHNLGRTPAGYIVTRVRGSFSPWRESSSLPARTDKQWSFIASGSSVTLDLYFF